MINPNGARYDAYISNERIDSNWDGVWDARAEMNSNGWSVKCCDSNQLKIISKA